MILGINTAQSTHELCFLEQEAEELKLLKEVIWPAQRHDKERLVPLLQETLQELGVDKKDIQCIVVVNGPGPFTALRAGVTFAKALAEALQIPIHVLDTFECLRQKAATADPLLVLLHAGGQDIGVQYFPEGGEARVGSISQLLADYPHGSIKVVAELRDTQSKELHSICLEKGWQELEGHQLQTLAEALMTFGLPPETQNSQVDALYFKNPVITKSNNPWKKPR